MAEAILFFVLCISIFPANSLAIYKFYRNGINRIFFTLITAFCITNMIYALVGFVNAVAKYSEYHPFGLIGCGISFCGSCLCYNVTMAVQALISYERRKVITSVSIATFSTRVYILLSASILFLTGFWILIYTVTVTLHFIPLHLAPNSTEIAHVCVAESHIFPGFLELVFAISELVVPGAIIIRNYWPIWKQALKGRRTVATNGTGSTAVSTIQAGQKKVQIRLALIMSLTVLAFNIFQLPFSILVLTILYQTLTGMVTMPHEFETAALCCIWLDSVINPLWTAFISKRPLQSTTNKFNTFSSRTSSKWQLKQPGSIQDFQRKSTLSFAESVTVKS